VVAVAAALAGVASRASRLADPALSMLAVDAVEAAVLFVDCGRSAALAEHASKMAANGGKLRIVNRGRRSTS